MGGHFEALVDLFFLFVGPFAEDEIDLRPPGVLIADPETYTRVRVTRTSMFSTGIFSCWSQ